MQNEMYNKNRLIFLQIDKHFYKRWIFKTKIISRERQDRFTAEGTIDSNTLDTLKTVEKRQVYPE